MVLDEWIEAVEEITGPVYLFFGGDDPFISCDRIQPIDTRFKQLNKDYTLKIYPEATHGFFCNERSSYHPLAAKNAWCELTQLLQTHLKD